MGKGSNKKKKNTSDKVRQKKTGGTQKINPFEIKTNRQKHDILGKRTNKHEKGRPGVSRSKAIQKRNETLLVDWKKRNKSNQFRDQRIGEHDAELNLEDKMLKRFAAERQKSNKSGLFNLNEDEDDENFELTHYGQSLAEIEKFEDIKDSDGEDENISAKMVAEEHFGGFLRKVKEGGDDEDEGKKKSWKERMEEIISKSKKEKYERQVEKEKSQEMTEKLDENWKELQAVIAASKAPKTSEEDKPKKDNYDVLVRELMFESRGQATDRLKTEDELAKEEQERLQSLESDRLLRMRGVSTEEQAKQQHRSADDLDDGYTLGKVDKRVRFVAYKDGKLLDDDEETTNKDDEDDGDEEDDDDDDGDDDDGVEEGEEEEGSSEDDDHAMDHLSDLESDEEEEVEAEQAEHLNKESTETKKSAGKVKGILKEKKEIIEEAKKELPYTFEAPSNYNQLSKLLSGQTDENQLLIIDRIRKCTHPSLAQGNKEKLQVLFALLLEYHDDLAKEDPPRLSLIDSLTKPLYELAQLSPIEAGKAVISLVKTKHDTLLGYCAAHGGRGVFPQLGTLLLLKLIAVLFPTSDYHHHVVTPVQLYMSQVLTQCPVNTRRDIASGLLMCTIFLEYVSFAKRFVPEAINFLRGVLFLAIKKDVNTIEPVIPPFKPVGRNIHFLELQDTKLSKKVDIQPLKFSNVFSMRQSSYLGSEEFRVLALHTCLVLLKDYFKLYDEYPAIAEISNPVCYFLEKLEMKNYPQTTQSLHEELVSTIKDLSTKKLKPLIMTKKKPKPMKMFEPKFDDVFEGQKKRAGSRKQNESERLAYKFKKERKGAIREIRLDNKFLARQKLQERIHRDNERKRKVRELLGDLATQEGEVKAIKRGKKF